MQQQTIVQELSQALEQNDEARVGRILTGLFVNTQKSGSGVTPDTIQQIVQESFGSLSSGQQNHWSSLSSSYDLSS